MNLRTRLQAATLVGIVATVLLTGCDDQSAPNIATAHPDQATGQTTGETPGQTSGQAQTGGGGKSSALADFIAAEQKFVDCAREHGMADLKDPDQYGVLPNFYPRGTPKNVVMAVRTECTKLQIPPPPEVRKLWYDQDAASITPAEKKMQQEYAACMQANGAPDFPDPLPNGMNYEWGGEEPTWDQASSGAQHASGVCDPIVHGPDAPP